MKKLLLLPLLYISALSIDAQKYQVAISQDLKCHSESKLGELLAADTSGLYVSFYQKDKFVDKTIINKYDQSFQLLWSKEFGLAGLYFGFLSSENFLFRMGAKVVDKQDVEYFIQPISKKGKAYKHKTIATHPITNKKDMPYIQAVSAADSSHLLFIYIKDSNRADEKFHFAINSFDQNFNPLVDRKFNFKQSEEQIDIIDHAINNEGNIFIVTQEKKERSSENKIYVIEKDGSNIKEIDFPCLKKKFDYVNLESLANGNTCIYGIYQLSSEKPSFAFKYMYIDSKGEILKDTDELLATEMSQALNTYERSIKITSPHLTHENTIKLSIENNYFQRSKVRDDFRKSKMAQDHVSRDIISLETSTKGKVLKASLIPKNQVNNNPHFNSHATLFSKEKGLFYLYNDNYRNLNPKSNNVEVLLPKNKASLVCATFINQEKLKKIELLSEKNIQSCFIPNSLVKLSENEAAFISLSEEFDNEYFKLGKIKIQ